MGPHARQALIDLLALAVVLSPAALAAWRFRGSKRWPATEGTIEDARQSEVPDGNGGTRTAVIVTYSFEANGTFYGGYEELYRRPRDRPLAALIGKKVWVRYKPGHPDVCRVISDLE